MAFFIVRAPQNFKLPQIDAQTLSAQEQEAMEVELQRLLPLRDDPWDNTIVKLPEFDRLQWEFMLPTYTSLNVCQKGVLQDLLTRKKLQSKFVILENTSDLNELCRKNGYLVIWEGYGRTLYRTRNN